MITAIDIIDNLRIATRDYIIDAAWYFIDNQPSSQRCGLLFWCYMPNIMLYLHLIVSFGPGLKNDVRIAQDEYYVWVLGHMQQFNTYFFRSLLHASLYSCL